MLTWMQSAQGANGNVQHVGRRGFKVQRIIDVDAPGRPPDAEVVLLVPRRDFKNSNGISALDILDYLHA